MKNETGVIASTSRLILLTTLFLSSGGFFSNYLLEAKTTTPVLLADTFVTNKPLTEVAFLIQQQTGYKVELKAIDGSFLVSGNFHNNSVETIFTHLLKKYNISVTIDSNKKLISVISLGDKIQLVNDLKKHEKNLPEMPSADSSESEKMNTEMSVDVDPLTRLSVEDIHKLHTRQVDEFERQMNDQNAIDPLTGITISNLKALHKTQILESNGKL